MFSWDLIIFICFISLFVIVVAKSSPDIYSLLNFSKLIAISVSFLAAHDKIFWKVGKSRIIIDTDVSP